MIPFHSFYPYNTQKQQNLAVPTMANRTSSDLCSPSSQSSGGVESRRGTPGTKATEFSPEDSRNELKAESIKNNYPPAFALQGVPLKFSPNTKAGHTRIIGSHDPFTTTSNVLTVVANHTAGIKLSPTAAAFEPLCSADNIAYAKANDFVHTAIRQPASAASQKLAISSAVSYLSATSVPDYEPESSTFSKRLVSVLGGASRQPIGAPAGVNLEGYLPSSNTLPADSKVADVGSSRNLKVSHLPEGTVLSHLNAIFLDPKPEVIVVTELVTKGIIYVKYADLRDARQIWSALKYSQVDCHVQYISARQFISTWKPQELSYTSEFEGRVLVSSIFSERRCSFDVRATLSGIRQTLEKYGDIALFEVKALVFPSLTICVEYYSIGAAETAIAQLNGSKLASVCFTVSRYSPDLNQASESAGSKHQGPLILGHDESALDHGFGQLNVNGSSGTSGPAQLSLRSIHDSSEPSPNGYFNVSGSNYQGLLSNAITTDHTPSHNARFGHSSYGLPPYLYNPFGSQLPLYLGCVSNTASPQRLMQQAPRSRFGAMLYQQGSPTKNGLRQNCEYAAGHHNIVDIERIRQGLDVRTTIMLRNIPNKIDQAMLKEIVDETSRGQYDFMYLRIDFANNCNVGYAFINFEDPYFIIDFVQARAGHRWNRFNSDKVAEVSYATIQGKDCLVQKFRNSSVMLEHPSFRPKIFHTGKDTMAGEEDKFPGPDNPSKMRRSVENAEHVGLFAPRAGQHFRDEQRRRRSQYDRGTRLAEIEDSYNHEDYESHCGSVQRRSGGNYHPYSG